MKVPKLIARSHTSLRLGWLLLVAWSFAGCGADRGGPPARARAPAFSVSALLSDAPGSGADRTGSAGYARALAPRTFTFPDDDGPHPAFRSEWWYFTGVLRAPGAGGAVRRFGYEMTIFRQALAPERPQRPSLWATRDVFMGHFAITDIDIDIDIDGASAGSSFGGGRSADPRFHAYERFARDGLALAGARARPLAVWVDDWRMDGPDDDSRRGRSSLAGPSQSREVRNPSEGSEVESAGDAGASLPIRLVARADDGSAIALTVGAGGTGGGGRGPIAHGERGLSRKGPEPGNASFYYSRTRLPTEGRVTIAGGTVGRAAGSGSGAGAPATFDCRGVSWMDREWSTAALGAGVRGWDWLGVHLSDGRDLMMYRLRGGDGRPTAESRLALIAADGRIRRFGPESFTATPLALWMSPRSGARYPTLLRIEVPSESLQLTVSPLVDDQELALAVVYWEGAVAISGTSGGVAIGGEGYLELTGYHAGDHPD